MHLFLSNLAIHCGRHPNRFMKMIQDQDTEGGPNATERDPAHLVVHVSQVPQKRPISPIPKPQPDGPHNQDGSTDDESPAAQQYLSLANHLLLPHRVSRARGRAAGAAPAPPTQAQAPSVIGLRLPPERPCASRRQDAPPQAIFGSAGSAAALSLLNYTGRGSFGFGPTFPGAEVGMVCQAGPDPDSDAPPASSWQRGDAGPGCHPARELSEGRSLKLGYRTGQTWAGQAQIFFRPRV